MKRIRKGKRLPVPQWEFGFSAETFNLIQETGIDGEKVSRERAEQGSQKEAAEAAQKRILFETMAFDCQQNCQQNCQQKCSESVSLGS